jgi:hypothetical protein
MPHKSKGHKSEGHKSEGAAGTSNTIVTLLNELAIGQVIPKVDLDNGTSLIDHKWGGFENGNATFVGPASEIVAVQVGKITAITL